MFYCKTIGEYAQANPNFNYELQPVCAKVKNLYVL